MAYLRRKIPFCEKRSKRFSCADLNSYSTVLFPPIRSYQYLLYQRPLLCNCAERCRLCVPQLPDSPAAIDWIDIANCSPTSTFFQFNNAALSNVDELSKWRRQRLLAFWSAAFVRSKRNLGSPRVLLAMTITKCCYFCSPPRVKAPSFTMCRFCIHVLYSPSLLRTCVCLIETLDGLPSVHRPPPILMELPKQTVRLSFLSHWLALCVLWKFRIPVTVYLVSCCSVVDGTVGNLQIYLGRMSCILSTIEVMFLI